MGRGEGERKMAFFKVLRHPTHSGFPDGDRPGEKASTAPFSNGFFYFGKSCGILWVLNNWGFEIRLETSISVHVCHLSVSRLPSKKGVSIFDTLSRKSVGI